MDRCIDFTTHRLLLTFVLKRPSLFRQESRSTVTGTPDSLQRTHRTNASKAIECVPLRTNYDFFIQHLRIFALNDPGE
jgi:hypothetical protein